MYQAPMAACKWKHGCCLRLWSRQRHCKGWQPTVNMDFRWGKCSVDQCQMTFPIKFIYPVTLRETHWNNKVPFFFFAITGINQYIVINTSILKRQLHQNSINWRESRETLLTHNKGWVLRNRDVIYRFRFFSDYFCTVIV